MAFLLYTYTKSFLHVSVIQTVKLCVRGGNKGDPNIFIPIMGSAKVKNIDIHTHIFLAICNDRTITQEFG